MNQQKSGGDAVVETREILVQHGISVEERDIDHAKLLSGYLVDAIKMDIKGALQLKSPFFINDILYDLMRLRQCSDLLEKFGIDTYPCQVFGDQRMPLDWLQASEDLYAANPSEFSRLKEPWHRVASFRKLWGHSLEEVPFKKFRELVRETARGLIEIRSALSDRPAEGGCGKQVNLTVRTKRHNLQIHYESLGNWKYLGYPTDPVKNCIHAGVYRFRARKYSAGRYHDVFVDDTARTIVSPVQTETLPV